VGLAGREGLQRTPGLPVWAGLYSYLYLGLCHHVGASAGTDQVRKVFTGRQDCQLGLVYIPFYTWDCATWAESLLGLTRSVRPSGDARSASGGWSLFIFIPGTVPPGRRLCWVWRGREGLQRTLGLPVGAGLYSYLYLGLCHPCGVSAGPGEVKKVFRGRQAYQLGMFYIHIYTWDCATWAASLLGLARSGRSSEDARGATWG
jgi:hypothetical protein